MIELVGLRFEGNETMDIRHHRLVPLYDLERHLDFKEGQ